MENQEYGSTQLPELDLSVYCCFDVNDLLQINQNNDYQVIEILFGQKTLYLAIKGLKIFSPPRQAKSQGSNALYLASLKLGNRSLLLQYLPPFSTTSLHYHANTEEIFHLLVGSACINTPWKTELTFDQHKVINVTPFTVHQVKTKDQGSVIMLEMISSEENPGMKDHFYCDPEQVIDIHSKGVYPANDLSNFTAHKFVFDGIACESMEGLIQSLKIKNSKIQKQYCQLIGFKAKKRGNRRSWFLRKYQTIYWQGKSINRFSQDYQMLLDRMYSALVQNVNFQRALLASGDKLLVHNIGKGQMQQTILTEMELCSRLLRLRHSLQNR